MTEMQKFYTVMFLAATPLLVVILYLTRDFFVSLIPERKTLILCPVHARITLKRGDIALIDSTRCTMCDFDRDAA